MTRDGACLGVAPGSGGRVTLSWAEAAGGISVCGSAEQDVLATGFQLIHAAVRRRKPVLAVDHTSDPGLTGRLAAVCAAAGAPLLVFGAVQGQRAGTADAWAQVACYEPFRHGDPGRRAALVTAMLSWDGPGRQYRRSCVAYLQDVFELLDAAPGDPRVPVLDDVIHLLNPVAMRARMEYVPAVYPRRDVLAGRTRVSMSLISAEPATTAELGRQLRELRASPFGRWLRPSAGGPSADIDLGRAIAERAVVLFRLGGPDPPAPAAPAESSAMLTRLVCQDLLAAGAALNGIGVDGDGIVWLSECGALPRHAVTDMIARGPGTGLPVLAATTSAPVAADLADLVNVVVAYRMDDAAAARRLSEVTGAAALAGPGGRRSRCERQSWREGRPGSGGGRRRSVRAAPRRIPPDGEEPAAARPARTAGPGPGTPGRPRRRARRRAAAGMGGCMTSSHDGRLCLGWQYSTPHPDPGPPPRRPTPPEQERLNPDWAAAQRREEGLLNRPLKAAFALAVVIGLAAITLGAVGWLDVLVAGLGVILSALIAAVSGYAIWQGQRALRARLADERARVGKMRAAQESRLLAWQAEHAARVREWRALRFAD